MVKKISYPASFKQAVLISRLLSQLLPEAKLKSCFGGSFLLIGWLVIVGVKSIFFWDTFF